MKTIAVIGAGFCGLSVSWELQSAGYCVHLYDAHEIGASTSGISAGLLHPFSGIHAKLAPEGREGLVATQILLNIAAGAVGKQVAEKSGILRLATDAEMVADFKRCAEKFDDVVWLSAEACLEKVPYAAAHPGIWIPEALTVHSSLYLQGLWQACAKLGVHFIQKKINSLRSLNSYDRVILTVGAETALFPELSCLSIAVNKGQVIELTWPHDLSALPLPLNSHAYLLMRPDGRSCLAGATFEREFSTRGADPEKALCEIMPKVAALIPRLKEASLLGCRAGMRASAPGRRPLLKQLNAKTWVLTGMGSKGLLYHALYAKRLAENLKI